MDRNRDTAATDQPHHGRTLWDFLSGLQRRQTLLAASVLAALALVFGTLLVVVLSAEPGSPIDIFGLRFTLRKSPSSAPAEPGAVLPVDTLEPPPPVAGPPSKPMPDPVREPPGAFSHESCMAALRREEPRAPPLISTGAMGIATGPVNGTYHRFGADLLALTNSPRLIQLVSTAGTPQSIQFIRSTEVNAGIGLLQADLFENQRLAETDGNPLRKVMSLHREEVHVLARSSIRRLADLSGQRVNMGPAQSGTYFTATEMLRAAGVRPSETANLPVDVAICDVLAGKIDATFFVAGKPTPVFTDLGRFLGAYPFLKARIRFVEINRDKDRLSHLEEATIEPTDYGWLDAPAKTVATRALLVAYDFSRKNPYYQKRCRQIHDLGGLILNNRTILQTDAKFHPKWKDVNFDSLRMPKIVSGTCRL